MLEHWLARAARAWRVLILALALGGLAAPSAHAAWWKAETDKFIVYSNLGEATARDYAAKLSTFDQVLRLFTPTTVQPPPRKFEVYLVPDYNGLAAVSPGIPSGILGFYSARPQASFAIGVANVRPVGDAVLFHEYAHRFMLDNFPAAYPTWFIEGWAEYFSTTEIGPEGVTIGRWNDNRLYSLHEGHLGSGNWFPMDRVIGRSLATFDDGPLFYAQSWLLVHYMLSSRERAAQLNRIISAIAAGQDPVHSFETITGMDTDALGRELKAYRKLRQVTLKDVGPSPPPPVVTQLPPSADDLLLDRLRIATLNPRKQNPAYLWALRRKARKYPGDELAELTLAEAEFSFGDVAAAEAILERRLKADPNNVEALRVAGVGEVAAARREPEKKADRLRQARGFLIRAYGQDKTDYRTLYAYAVSRSAEPNYPNDNDANALMQAYDLAPGVGEIAIAAGQALLARGRRDDAVEVLSAIANNPHGGRSAARARTLLEGKPAAEAGKAADDDEDPD